jgi:hypothetical protein
MIISGKPYLRGRLSTVDLNVLTCLDQLLFKLEILFTFLVKQATLMRRSNQIETSPSVSIPGIFFLIVSL